MATHLGNALTLLLLPVSVHAPFVQQGSRLVRTGAMGAAQQGQSVSVSADGNTAIVGALGDNGFAGAAWVFTRSGAVSTQQGTKLVGTGAVGTTVQQGTSVAIAADGNTAIVGGIGDNGNLDRDFVYGHRPQQRYAVFVQSCRHHSKLPPSTVSAPVPTSAPRAA